MKLIHLFLFCFLFLVLQATIPDKNDSGASSDTQSQLKNLLDKIDKLRKQHQSLLDQNSSLPDLPPTLNQNLPFSGDPGCMLQTEDECVAGCSKQDLCQPCFKSHNDGFGYKCLSQIP